MRIRQARKEVATKFGPNATIARFNLCGTYYYQVLILDEIVGSASSPYRAICDAAETLNSAMIVKDSHFANVLAHLAEIDAEWMRGRKAASEIETATPTAEPVAGILDLPVSTVASLGTRHDLTLVTDSQDAAAIRDNFGPKWAGAAYDSYFVRVEDGDYKEVWGMAGIVPHLSKLVTRVA